MIDELLNQLLGRVSVDDPAMQLNLRLTARLQQHLLGKWRNAQRMGLACQQRVRDPRGQVLRCVEPMSGTCVACRAPVCVHHSAVVFEQGDLICFSCIGHAQKTVPKYEQGAPSDSASEPQSPADQEKLRRKFMKRLKLTGDPTEDEIRAAFKREAAKAHPDRVPPEKRQKAHEKFVMLGEARDWLLKHAKRKAA